MGTWGSGPFDSDTAEDTLEELHDMSPQEREAMLLSVFHSAREGQGRLSSAVLPEEVIVAAAVVAANTSTGGEVSWHEDHSIEEWLTKPIDGNLTAEAMRAVESALPPDGWYWSGWVNSDDRAEAREWIDRILLILRSAGSPD
ncbi:DUF4259 domain-containing protein [Streptomyces yaizuensis]|uniref:DUF4259 domain-containing protein n=1 Tax=Streptomyces yaizuensis TaxID=2989713 RepID=A0ABQ5NRR3_9ACTN|nr:DUF4259 domain-containing protein [Streptomyces sp. YSPA8]GLF93030.1 DUF4259 domain-containing protein [Streptomyces sp. YSPA8]